MALLDDLVAKYPDEYSQIKSAYNTYLGRDPDTSGLTTRLSTLPGAGGSWTTDLATQLSDIANSSEAQSYKSGKSSDSGSSLDFSNIESLGPKSESYTGLPDWGQSLLKDYFSNNFGKYSSSLSDSLNALSSAPSTIESTRKAMISQYQNALDQSYNDSISKAISNLAGKGVLSSSTAEGTLSNVAKDLMNKYSDYTSTANAWAGKSLLDNLSTNVTAQQKQMALLNALLESAKTSTSSSTNDLAPYSLLLPLLLGSS